MTRIVKHPHERRLEIIKAAQHLFQTQDYEKTTMQHLIDYLGIAKGTIYHYFSSKEELLEAVVENMVDENIALMQMRTQETEGNALKKLRALIEAGSMAAEHESILEGLHCKKNSAMHLRLLVATLIKLAPLYAQVIQQGCDEGIFSTPVPLECAEFLLAAVQFLTDRGIHPWAMYDLKRRVQAFPALIERQLHAPAGSFNFLHKLFEASSQ